MDNRVQGYIRGIQDAIARIYTIKNRDDYIDDQDMIDYIQYLQAIKSGLIERIIHLQREAEAAANDNRPLDPQIIAALEEAHDQLVEVAENLDVDQNRKRPLLDGIPREDRNKLRRINDVTRRVRDGPINDPNENFLEFDGLPPAPARPEFTRENITTNIRAVSETDINGLVANQYKLDGSVKKNKNNLLNRILDVEMNGSRRYDVRTNERILNNEYDRRLAFVDTRDKLNALRPY